MASWILTSLSMGSDQRRQSPSSRGEVAMAPLSDERIAEHQLREKSVSSRDLWLAWKREVTGDRHFHLSTVLR